MFNRTYQRYRSTLLAESRSELPTQFVNDYVRRFPDHTLYPTSYGAVILDKPEGRSRVRLMMTHDGRVDVHPFGSSPADRKPYYDVATELGGKHGLRITYSRGARIGNVYHSSISSDTPETDVAEEVGMDNGPEPGKEDVSSAPEDDAEPLPPDVVAAQDGVDIGLPEPMAGEDRVGLPPFYRDDLQNDYDILFFSGVSKAEAINRIKAKFGLDSVEVMPNGEVRSPGVFDRGSVPAAPPDNGTPAPPPMAAPLDMAGPMESLDDIFYQFIAADGAPEDFNEYIISEYPLMTDQLQNWTLRASEHGPLMEASRGLRHDQMELYERWLRVANMRPSSYYNLITGPSIAKVLESHRSGKTEVIRLGRLAASQLLLLKGTPVEHWNAQNWEWASRQVNTINRLRANPAPITEHGTLTRKYWALKAWGHDPTLDEGYDERRLIVEQRAMPGRVWLCLVCDCAIRPEALVLEDEEWYHAPCHQRVIPSEVPETSRRLANRLLDALPGRGPHYVGNVAEGYKSGRGPDFKSLKKGRRTLTPEERAEVMSRKATWHHGLNGAPSPAVWKSQVNGRTWYVTNTHRAYNVAPTLRGAIGRYHAFIKSTA